jgi:hypothetical protein
MILAPADKGIMLPTLIEVSRVELEREFPATEAAPTSSTKKQARPIDDGIRAAIAAIWPNGIPRGLKAKDRNNKIEAWLQANGCSVPASPQAFSRAVQRARSMNPRA